MLKNKKIIVIILIISIILNILTCIVFADDFDEEENEDEQNEVQNEIVNVISSKVDEPSINSRSAVIFDRTTKKVIWGKKENEVRAMASTTKIMSSIIVLENTNLNDVVTISKKAASIGGSCLKIKTGDKITVNDLLYGLMLRSGNDAAVALAEYVGGSIEGFAKLMNEKAIQLGLNNTHFVTPHGLDNDEHYTTAYELAVLTDYALNSEKFAQIVNTKNTTIYINGVPREISNTNELLGNLNGVNGVKTGFTGNAGRCLVTSCTRNGNQIITVVLGADTKKQRTQDSIKLIEYAFNNFERINIEEIAKKEFENWKQINQKRIYINKAQEQNIELELKDIQNKIIPLKMGESKDINIEINCIYEYEAPVLEQTKIGNLMIKNKDEIIEVVDIVCKETVEKNNIYNYMKHFLYSLTKENVLNLF